MPADYPTTDWNGCSNYRLVFSRHSSLTSRPDSMTPSSRNEADAADRRWRETKPTRPNGAGAKRSQCRLVVANAKRTVMALVGPGAGTGRTLLIGGARALASVPALLILHQLPRRAGRA